MSKIMTISLVSAVALCATSLFAETDCSTPPGATVPGGTVNAQAAFTAGDGFITVSVTNNLADPRSAGQLLSGLAFTLSSGQTSGTLGPNSANIRTVNADHTFLDFGPSSTGWALQSNFNGGLFLCVLCTDLGAAGPKDLLIGAPATDGKYDSANRSIAGNKPHNPFTAGTATFLVFVPGLTSDATVTTATFFFSTAEGVSVTGACSPGGILLT